MTITHEDLCQFFEEYISGTGSQRRKLSIHVLPVESKNGPGEETPTATRVVSDSVSGEATDTTDGQSLEETDSGDTCAEVRVLHTLELCVQSYHIILTVS